MGREEALHVSVPPIWSLFSTYNFYKTVKTSCEFFKTDKLTSVSGRYAVHACQQGPAGGDGTTN